MCIEFRKEILNIEPYIPGKPIEEVRQEFGLTDIVKLASNENPLGPSKLAKQALQKMVSSAHIYPDGNNTELKAKLAKKLGVSTDCLIVGNGSDEVLKMIGEAFLKTGDEVVVASPTFSEYQFVARIMGSKEIVIPLKDFTHDLGAMERAITDHTKVVFVCNPNNPTGTIVGKSKLDQFVQSVPDHSLIVIDEAYHEYVQDPTYPNSLDYVKNAKNVIITRTFSKIYGLAGLRIGYAIAKPSIIDLLNRVREPFNVNGLAQAAACASLDDTYHIKESISINEEGKKYLYAQFRRLGLDYVPTEANFIFVNVGRDSNSLFQSLLRLGIIVRPADIFGMPMFIRVTIGTPEQNQRLIVALEEVLKS